MHAIPTLTCSREPRRKRVFSRWNMDSVEADELAIMPIELAARL